MKSIDKLTAGILMTSSRCLNAKRENRLERICNIQAGMQETSQTWGVRYFEGIFVSRKMGHFLKRQRALLRLLQNLGGTHPQCHPRFLRLSYRVSNNSLHLFENFQIQTNCCEVG